MNREFLKGLGLEDDAIEKVMTEHGKTVTAVTSERDSLKEQLTKSDEQLTALKESTKGNEELQQKLTDLEKERDQAKTDGEAKLSQAQKDFAIDLALRDAGARNSKTVRALLDTDKLEMKDGKLTGFDDQLKEIQKDNDYLFQGEPKPGKPNITTKGNPDPTGGAGGNEMAAALGIKADPK